jgi:RND family efflux transporter MFP subunit
VPVTEAPVTFIRDETVLESVGTGIALKAVTIYPSVAGEVASVGFAAGDRVEQDDILVRLDDRRERLALDLAQVAVRDAEQTLARFERASQTGSVSESEVDSARTALQRAGLEREQAEIALADRRIRAPFTGIVGIAAIEPGDRVSIETALTSLDDRSELLVDFEVPEAFINRLAIGQSIRATTWSLPGVAFQGHISAMESRVDAQTRTLRIRGRFPNDNDRLRPGMSFAVFVDLPGDIYATVPETAVQWGRDGAYLWRISDGVAEKLFVTIHKRTGGRIMLEGPLEQGDSIVAEGVQRMREGIALSVVGRLEPAEPQGETDADPAGGS